MVFIASSMSHGPGGKSEPDHRHEIMRNSFILALLALGSCRSVEEEPRYPGVHSRLALLDADPALGSPLRIRLDLVNDSDTPMVYDAQQCDVNGSFEILGPEGKVRFIDGPRSTGGSYSALAPRSTVTLIKESDLTAEYLISKPGRHTIRFRGRIEVLDQHRYDQSWKEAEADSNKAWSFQRYEATVGPSDPVTVHVRPGTIPEKFVVAEKLLPALPPDWEFAINWIPPLTADPEYTLFRPNRKKGDSVIVLRLSQGPPLKEERRIGEWTGKNVYVRSSADDERAWPDHDRRLVEILNGR